MLVEFSQEDILRSKIIKPAWYRVRINKVTEALSKNGDSTNWILEGKVLHDADTGDKEFENVPSPYWNLNSKAKGFMVGFFASLGVEILPGTRVDFKNAEGRELDVFVENEMYENRMVNRINHKYRAVR